MGGGQSTEEGVSNHSGCRAISDRLDATLFRGGYQNESGTRAVLHGVYHEGKAIQKKMAGNGSVSKPCTPGEHQNSW